MFVSIRSLKRNRTQVLQVHTQHLFVTNLHKCFVSSDFIESEKVPNNEGLKGALCSFLGKNLKSEFNIYYINEVIIQIQKLSVLKSP